MKTITLTLDYDTDCENPLTSCDGMWTIYKFRQSSRNGSDNRDDFFAYDRRDAGLSRGRSRWQDYIPATLDLFFKLRKGLAFTIHESGCDWYTSKHDTDGREGVLIWENPPDDMGAKTYDERAKDAQNCLDEYNRWAQGDCYGFKIEEPGEEENSCWGFIGRESILDEIKWEMTDERPLRIVYADRETKEIAGHYDWGDGIETMTHEEYESMMEEEDEIEAEGQVAV